MARRALALFAALFSRSALALKDSHATSAMSAQDLAMISALPLGGKSLRRAEVERDVDRRVEQALFQLMDRTEEQTRLVTEMKSDIQTEQAMMRLLDHPEDDQVLTELARQIDAIQATTHQTNLLETWTEVNADPAYPPPLESRPQGMTEKAWSLYTWAQEKMSTVRGSHGNMIASFAAMPLGPENCMLKLPFILYTEVDEDDYPYWPRGCGEMFETMASSSHRPVSLGPLALALIGVAALRNVIGA